MKMYFSSILSLLPLLFLLFLLFGAHIYKVIYVHRFNYLLLLLHIICCVEFELRMGHIRRMDIVVDIENKFIIESKPEKKKKQKLDDN